MDKAISRFCKTPYREWLIILGLAILAFMLRVPFLEQPFDNDSASNAYHARLILRGEPLYGLQHPGHHLPALYYLYAGIFRLLGDSVWAIKLVLVFWTIVTAWLLYRLAVRVFDWQTGVLAALFYIVLTSHIYLFGSSGQRELFVNLPRLAALLVLLQLLPALPRVGQYIWVGLLCAIVFWFKATYLSPLILTGLVLFFEWQWKKAPLRLTVMRGLWVGGGFILGLAAVLVYFYAIGLLPNLLAVFTLGYRYVDTINTTPVVGSQTWLLYILFPLAGLAVNNIALLALSLAGFLLILVRTDQRHTPALYVAWWYILSFIEAGSNRRFFYHYYLLIVPPLCLLAAWFLLIFYRDIKRLSKSASLAGRVWGVLLAITLFISGRQNFNYYFHYARYKLGLDPYQTFLIQGWPEEGTKLVQLQKLSDYIAQRTTPSDYIYYWSFNVQPYYLADRHAPIKTLWPEDLALSEPLSQIFGPRTKYIILDRGINIETPEWLYAGLNDHYTLETTLDDQEIYRRVR